MKLPKNKRKLFGNACAIFLWPFADLFVAIKLVGSLIYVAGCYCSDFLEYRVIGPMISWTEKGEPKAREDRDDKND